MKIKINAADFRWWFWAITLVFIIAALVGWTPGYYLVMAISAIQVVYFLSQEKSLIAFPVQTRVVYFGLTLFGLWPEVRFVFYALLLIGTIMVTFFDQCSIARVLRRMPWNREREVRLN